MTEKTTAKTFKAATAEATAAEAGATPAEQIYAAFVESAELMLKAGADAARKTYDSAVSATREPATTAMKAGGLAMKDYDDAVAFGRDNIDAVTESSTIAVHGLQDVGKEWVGLVQKSADEFPATVKAFAACKTVKEATDLHSEFVKTSIESFTASAMKFQQLSMKVATATAEPINKRFTDAMSKYGKPFAA
ncbi:MAG TPA: phasin family protein [Alphaproteobacteria bacterium]|jgi:phasin family protein